jgi:hypothetical protein
VAQVVLLSTEAEKASTPNHIEVEDTNARIAGKPTTRLTIDFTGNNHDAIYGGQKAGF